MRLGIISDLHCGHPVGLTPPDYWRPNKSKNELIQKVRLQQEERWNWFIDTIYKAKKEGPFDYLILNGDAIDGSSKKIGGAEMTEKLATQADMAEYIIKCCITPKKTKGVFMSSGTNYHTRSGDGAIDMELTLKRQLESSVRTEYDPVPYLRIGGMETPFIIKARHHTAKGNIKSGGAIPGAVRQMVDSILASKLMGDPDVNMIILSHVHEASMTTMYQANGTPLYVMTTPALQGRGSEYGMKMCSGVVHFGFVVLNIEKSKNGGFDVGFEPYITQLNADKISVYDLK